VDAKGWKAGQPLLHHRIVVCANADCKELSMTIWLMTTSGYAVNGWQDTKIKSVFQLLPSSSAKPQPDYIPAPLREDYNEACAVRDLSPKASATLARRCLQGMIRDFCKVNKQTLDQEIKALRALVDAGAAPHGVTQESVDGIDHVRKIGNIGAHMEADVNLIVEIEPEEAQVLIELIETLFDEWYVAQYKRDQKFVNLKALADSKKEALQGLKAEASAQKLLGVPNGMPPA
jgi:hypothetical protein